MKVDDPRIKLINLDGQSLYLPNNDAWKELKKIPIFGEHKIPIQDLIFNNVERNSKFKELKSALGFAFGSLMFYELLEFDKLMIRVFVENVICEHCKQRLGISATPGVMDIYLGCKNQKSAMKKGFHCPVLSCPKCSKILQRRHVIWLANINNISINYQ